MYLRIMIFILFFYGCSSLTKINRNPSNIKEKKLDQKTKYFGRDTFLHTATYYENFDLVKSLLEEKRSPNIQNKQSETPLHIAVDSWSIDILNLLLSHKQTDVNMRNEYLQTPLLMAMSNSYYPGVLALLEHKKIDLNKQDEDGNIFAHFLIRYGYSDEEGIQLINKLHTLKNINITNKKDNTPLHEIVLYLPESHLNLILLNLISVKGTKLNIRNNNNLTIQDRLRKRKYYQAENILVNFQKKPVVENVGLKERTIPLEKKRNKNKKILELKTKNSELKRKDKTIFYLQERIKYLLKNQKDIYPLEIYKDGLTV